MKLLNQAEVINITEYLKQFVGSQLQDVLFADNCLYLCFYFNRKDFAIVFDNKATHPMLIYIDAFNKKRIKKQPKPISLFSKAHLVNRRILSVDCIEAEGRVIQIDFSGEPIGLIKVSLFPHGRNLYVEANGKTIFLNKPQKLKSKSTLKNNIKNNIKDKEIAVEPFVGHSSNHSVNPKFLTGRSALEIFEEWQESKFNRQSNSQLNKQSYSKTSTNNNINSNANLEVSLNKPIKDKTSAILTDSLEVKKINNVILKLEEQIKKEELNDWGGAGEFLKTMSLLLQSQSDKALYLLVNKGNNSKPDKTSTSEYKNLNKTQDILQNVSNKNKQTKEKLNKLIDFFNNVIIESENKGINIVAASQGASTLNTLHSQQTQHQLEINTTDNQVVSANLFINQINKQNINQVTNQAIKQINWQEKILSDWKNLIDLNKSLKENLERCFDRSKNKNIRIVRIKKRIKELNLQLKNAINKNLKHSSPSEINNKVNCKTNSKKNSQLNRVLNNNSTDQVNNIFDLFKSSGAQGKKFHIDGLEFYLGKAAKDNIALLRKSKPWHLWFHLKDFPSSHGFLITNKKQKISFKTIQQAGVNLSIYGAKGMSSGDFVEIVYAESRYVKPIKGDKLGRVRFDNQKQFTIKLP